MSVVKVLNVKLQRNEPSVSWGFNVQGGKEFHSPLMIQKVSPGSLAEKCSILPGDYILRIGNIIAENFTHGQAREAIIRQGNYLELTLQRGAPPRSDDYNSKFEFPHHQLMNPENVDRVSIASPQVGIQLSNNKALLTQSYNSPMGLYSSQNIADTLVSTIKNLEKNDTKKEHLSESFSSTSLSSSSCSSSSTSSTSPILSSSMSNSITYIPKQTFDQNLNSKPRPFISKTVQTEINQPKKFESIKTFLKKTTQTETVEIKQFESCQIIDNNNLNTFRAVPFKPSALKESPRRFSAPIAKSLPKEDLKTNLNGRLLLKSIESELNDDELFIKAKKESEKELFLKKSPSRLNSVLRGHVSKLDDPGKPSTVQSRSFRLLQQTLENGLLEKDRNEIQSRRSSLNTSKDISPQKDLAQSQNNLSSDDSSQSASLNDFYKRRLNTRSQSLATDLNVKPIGQTNPYRYGSNFNRPYYNTFSRPSLLKY